MTTTPERYGYTPSLRTDPGLRATCARRIVAEWAAAGEDPRLLVLQMRLSAERARSRGDGDAAWWLGWCADYLDGRGAGRR